MMKRLLVLAMVLAMAPVATAVLSIGANGNLASGTITIGPEDILDLDIRTSADYGFAFMLVVNSARGSISGGGITGNSGDGPYDYSYYVPYFAFDADIITDPYNPTVNGISWVLGYNDDLSSISGVVFSLIDFGYGGPGDADIQLWRLPSGSSTWVHDDTLLVHQTPEPLTMALLGLGGLFLRRRK